jgi:cell division protein FtsB
VSKSTANPSISLGQMALSSIYRNRRRLATASAMMLAAALGYFAVAGDNGIAVYKQKRVEDKQLASQIEALKQENARLQAHVERLKSDPNAIEHEAREKLHYTRPGEVIYTLRDAPEPSRTASQSGVNRSPATPHPPNPAEQPNR